MKNIKKLFRFTLATLLIAYVILCLGCYFFQKYFLMTNTKSSGNAYQFEGKFEEMNILTKDRKKLNGLLFKSDSSKGLIFYLHGGGHTLEKWGKYAETYTNLKYDIFFLDYRGVGKSEGALPTENQLYEDVQVAYDYLKAIYDEERIIVFGYSFGTAPASVLAAANKPKKLILQAPYYSGEEAVKNNYPLLYSIIPSFLFRYKLKTYEFIKQTKTPIVVFHGNKDSTFDVSQSYKLKKLFKPGDELIILEKQGHNGFTENPEYLRELARILK